MNASFSGVSRDTTRGVETCVQASRESGPSGTDGDGRSCGWLVLAQASARVDLPTALHFLLQYGPRSPSNTCVPFFERKSLDTCTTFHHDLVSVIPGEKKVGEKRSKMKICNCRFFFLGPSCLNA